MNVLKLFYLYIIIFLKSKMEYRFSFFMDLFAQVFTNAINCICIWVLTYKFQKVGGWSFYELLLLYSINLTSFGFGALLFWAPMYSMENMIKQGDFDKILYKPISPFIYLIISQFDYVFFAHIFLGMFLLVISVCKLNIIISLTSVLIGFLLLISASLIQASLLIICGSINFWFVKSGQLIDILVWGIRKFLEYPISIYNCAIKFILVFIIPYAFVSYFPAAIVLSREMFIGTRDVIIIITPIIAIVLFAFSCILWHKGLLKYDSTGS